MDIYPKQCNHRVSFGSTTRYCGNYARKGKDFCWMHDGTPKKSERLQAENAKLKEMKSITTAIPCPDDDCCGTMISTVQIGMARCNECNKLWELKQALKGESE